jgi:hypothetical protein
MEKTPSVATSRVRADRDQEPLELVHVAVGVALALGPAEADPVDDRGVVERVRDDHVGIVEERLEETAVGVEAGCVEHRVVHAEERGDGRLEIFVDGLGAADEAHAREPQAPAGEALLRGPHQGRVVGEPEVVVGAEVEDLMAAHRDVGALRTLDDPLALPEPGLADGIELAAQPRLDRSVHG